MHFPILCVDIKLYIKNILIRIEFKDDLTADTDVFIRMLKDTKIDCQPDHDQ